jgi:hypothetical protein
MQIPIKKVLIILGFLAMVFMFAFLIYSFFFKTPAEPTPIQQPIGPTTGSGGLPGIGNANINGNVGEVNVNTGLPETGKIPQEVSQIANGGLTETKPVIDKAVEDITMSSNGSLNYYDKDSGKFYRRLSDGTISEISSKVFYNVSNVTWSNQGDRAIMEYPDGSKTFYDFTGKRQYTLPKEMKNFSFSATGDKIGAQVIGPTQESNWLVTSNPDGSNLNFLEPIGDKGNDVAVNWSPNSQVVATFRDTHDAVRQEIIFIGQNQENFKSLIVPGRGFTGQWTPDSNKMLYSVYNQGSDYKPTLYLVDANGDNIGNNNAGINLNTWSDKCTISRDSSSAYCAVPRDLPFGSGWYPELADGLPDDFYQVDLKSGRTSLLAIPSGGDYSANHIFLSSDERMLYFTDQVTGRVYNINLR